MNELVSKLQEIVREMEKEKGRAFFLSGVVEPEGNFGKLDLVVSADWIEEEKIPFLKYASSKIAKKLTLPELLKFGSVMLMDPKAEATRWIVNSVDLPHEERNRHVRFGDIEIRYAQLFAPQGGQQAYAN